MASAASQVSSAFKSEHATAALYVLILGLALSDIVPTLADFFVFYENRKLREEYTAGTISPKQYWTKTAIAYYTYNFLYWVIIGVVVVNVPGGFSAKLKWLLGLAGAGAVIAILHSNITKDEQEQALAQEALIPK